MFRPNLAELPAQKVGFTGALEVIVQDENIVRVGRHSGLFAGVVTSAFRGVRDVLDR